jgi:hypothetical protein
LYTYSEVDVEVQVYAGQHQVLGRLLDNLLGDTQLLLREEPAQNWKEVRGSEMRGEGAAIVVSHISRYSFSSVTSAKCARRNRKKPEVLTLTKDLATYIDEWVDR